MDEKQRKLRKLAKLQAIIEKGSPEIARFLFQLEDNIYKVSSDINTLIKSISEQNSQSLDELRQDFEDIKPTNERLVEIIRPLIPEVKDGDTPNEKELLKIIKPLIPKVENGKTPSKSEILDLIKPLIPEIDEDEIIGKIVAIVESNITLPSKEEIVQEVEDNVSKNLPKLGEPIRDSLELLQGDKRLDKSAVKGLDELLNETNENLNKRLNVIATNKPLSEMLDVNVLGLQTNQSLKWNGREWIPYTPTDDKAVWGEITGTLTDQTDLTTYIADQLSTQDTLQEVTDNGATTTNSITAPEFITTGGLLEVQESSDPIGDVSSSVGNDFTFAIFCSPSLGVVETGVTITWTSGALNGQTAVGDVVSSGGAVLWVSGATSGYSVGDTFSVAFTVTANLVDFKVDDYFRVFRNSSTQDQPKTSWFNKAGTEIGGISINSSSGSPSFQLGSSVNASKNAGSYLTTALNETIRNEVKNTNADVNDSRAQLEVQSGQGINITTFSAIAFKNNSINSNAGTTQLTSFGAKGLSFSATDINNASTAAVKFFANNNLQSSEYNDFSLGGTETVFNDLSNDVNFRVESNSNANAFFIDGGVDKVSIGESAVDAKLNILSTTEQLRIKYNDSNYFTTTVGSTGTTTFNAVGSGAKFVFSDTVELDADLDHDGSNIGFFGTAPTTKQTALTTQLTDLTHTAPGTPDYAIQDLIDSSVGATFGFATKDEGNTVLSVIKNLQTRVSELETKLKNYGLLA